MTVLLAVLQLMSPPAPPPPAGIYHGRLDATAVTVPRLAEEPEIDGVLGEAAWSQAAVLTGFSQYQPLDGVPAADSTDVLVWYSPHALSSM